LSLASRSGVRGLGRLVAAAACAFGLALIAFSFSRTFWLSAALLVPVGGAMMVQMASSNTLLQAMVPDALRGRVMSVYSMMFMGMAPFGALFAGTVAEHAGAPHTVAIGGAVCVVAGTIFGLQLPSIRPEARRLIVAQGMAGGDPPAEVTAPGAVT
jgi:MFS family permease